MGVLLGPGGPGGGLASGRRLGVRVGAWSRVARSRWAARANPSSSQVGSLAWLGQRAPSRGCTPVTRGWVQEVFQRLGVTAQDLRVDRLLAEVQATRGDPLKLSRLFGITDTTAIRYCLELGPLDQASEPVPSP
jgi:hypothetical protein